MSVRRLLGRRSLTRLGSVTIAGLVAASPALAGDYLRGAFAPEAEAKSAGVDWAGVYFGAHAGITSARGNYAALAPTLGRNVLPDLAISDQIPPLLSFGTAVRQGSSMGLFAGYNFLWDDVVLGVEMDYTRSSIATQSNAPGISRALTASSTGSDIWRTTVSANGRSTLDGWLTMRGRVGWAAGYFMPFITAGLALGNITSTGTATGSTTQFAVTADPVTGAPVLTPRGSTTNTTNLRHRGITYGGAVGAGVDMAFFSNVFVRAEWQYIQLASGGTRPEISINTARVAGGVKF
jgi:outer membrane immunogenic protein